LEALGRLTRAHLTSVPFESVTSILRRRARPEGPVPPLDPDELLQGWEERRGGGLCFEIVEMFSRLLVALGYRAEPVLGFITFLGHHQAILVEIDGRRLLVDGGGAPFFEPIPLDRVSEVRRAGLAYGFRPDEAAENCVQDRWIDGAWAPFCRYELQQPDPQTREAAYQRHHTPGQSWVVDNLRLIRCAEEEVYALRDGQLTHYTPDGKRTEQVTGKTAHMRVAAEVFGLPGLPIDQALEALAERARPLEVG